WVTGKWSECSVTCGGGFQSRAIYCVESHNDQKGFNENLNVAEKYCWQKQRPTAERKCGTSQCPQWEKGDWSQCSVTCGKGFRVRLVECRQENERVDDMICSKTDRPDDHQPCFTGIKCPANPGSQYYKAYHISIFIYSNKSIAVFSIENLRIIQNLFS
ncbi:unnamed protein product, partial [Dracunculus medinensis]|uniref:ADAM_CR_2 domain-containing protein n=1 Tax=Dracunculus medinensis TaxID=318479 RepID=A0A0N4U8S2_DRAME